MSEDDDTDVVIPGTEFSKYLDTNFKDLYEPYVGGPSFREQPRLETGGFQRSDVVSQTRVENWMRSAIDEILHSNLLLDEDASYMYEISSQLVVVKTRFSVCAVATGFLSTLLCSNIYLRKRLYSPVSGLLFCAEALCFSASLYYSLKAFEENSQKKAIAKLCTTLQKIYYYVRKTLQFLREQNSCLFSKELLSQMGQGKKGAGKFSYLKRKSNEMLVTIKSLIQCLLDLTFASQVFTVGLINIVPLANTMDSADRYLAYYTFDQLGVSKYFCTDNLASNELNSNISSVEVLKNIYLLMQSECLTRLGLCFCPNVWQKCAEKKVFSKIFQRVKQYNNVCNDVLKTLEHQYNINFLPNPSDFEGCKNVIDSKLIESYSVIHKYTLSLNSMLCDSRMIEEYIDQNGSLEDILDAAFITSKLETIEKEHQDSFKSLQNVKRYFSQLRNKSNISNESKDESPVPASVPSSESGNNVPTVVGFSDFTPTGEDKVYLCVTDGMKEVNCTEEYDTNPQPKLPQNLLKELKGALTNKKQEFEQREMEALKNNPDYKQYMDFELPSESLESTTGSRTIEDSVLDSSITRKRLSIKLPTEIVPSNEIFTGEFAFHKSIASQAVNANFRLKNSDEEVFASGTESESEC